MNSWCFKGLGKRFFQGTAVLCLLAGLLSCKNFSMPRLTFEEEPQVKLPISVVYKFDPNVTQAVLETDACGLPYTVNSGEHITQAFLEVGKESFNSVMVSPPGQQAIHVSSPHDLVIQIHMVHQSLTPDEKIGDHDQYYMNVLLQLQAVYSTSQGADLAKSPLTYQERRRVFTPQLSGQESSCTTSVFDTLVYDGAEQLAKDMLTTLPRVLNPQSVPGTTAQTQPPHAAPPQPINLGASRPSSPPSLSFRTMLQDGNDNLILEGGEKVVLQVQTTNTGNSPIQSAVVNLSGNLEIIGAFSRAAPLPIPLETLQPGETKTTEVRGRLPNGIQEGRGELIVAVILSNGASAGTHKILAALQPGTRSSQSRDTTLSLASSSAHKKAGAKERQRKVKQRKEKQQDESPYYALVVNVNRYRDPWPQASSKSRGNAQAITDVLKGTGMFLSDHIRILNNSHATKTDIEEALFSWARPRIEKGGIFFLYFSGQAVTDIKTGEVYLVPYEGSPKTSANKLISLRILQHSLGKLQGKVILLFLDSPVTPLIQRTGQIGYNGKKPLRWGSGLPTTGRSQGGPVIQIRRTSMSSGRDPVELVSGLLGGADRNQDNIVTLGELLYHVRNVAQIRPTPPRNFREAGIPLSQ